MTAFAVSSCVWKPVSGIWAFLKGERRIGVLTARVLNWRSLFELMYRWHSMNWVPFDY